MIERLYWAGLVLWHGPSVLFMPRYVVPVVGPDGSRYYHAPGGSMKANSLPIRTGVFTVVDEINRDGEEA